MASSYNLGYMGIGALMDQDTVFKRKFRWTMYLQPNCPQLANRDIDVWFVKVASRPSISFDETELNFLNSKAWIPGKASYETMTITYIDVAPTRRESANLYAYLGSVYQFHNSDRKMGSAVRDYTATGTLTLYDGCGTPIEDWQFEDLWPQAINFGDLDQSSSDTVDIELTMRYSKFTYNPRCGNVDWGICCSGCSKVAGPPSR
jgi:hypothetical protein